MLKFLISLALIGLAFGLSICRADPLQQALQIQQQTNQQSRALQQEISRQDEKRQEMRAELAQLKVQQGQWSIYNHYLKKQGEDQLKRKQQLTHQLDELSTTRAELVPLMEQMISQLELFVQQDIPLHRQARLARVQLLSKMMGRSDLSIAEKYRQVSQAYQQELHYGNSVTTYQSAFKTPQGDMLQANYFHFGRLLLAVQTLDASRGWRWDAAKQRWIALENEQNDEIAQAIHSLKSQQPLSLLKLPLLAAPVIKEAS
ncbi:DUF3450 domain-containing protein [Dongshaea marina]|uniref:DUF3450 domain-containing protein n=1 Tax=Dongshaea marina TaxID=2047966 RepID=UPI00131F11F1|nr:DUF3450 domain-containing protein [Dongshaea marina]